jgi:hypothetical protein
MAMTTRLLSMNPCELRGPGQIHPAEKDDISECVVPPTNPLSRHRTCRSPRSRNWSRWDSNDMQLASLAISRAGRTESDRAATTRSRTACAPPERELPVVHSHVRHSHPLHRTHVRTRAMAILDVHEIRATISSISRCSTSKLAE